MATTVVGRDEELGSVEAFLAATETHPAALVLTGEPGIGKTILWEAGVEEARRRFGRVLSHRSVEAEALLSFSGLSDLLASVFDEVAPALAPLRRRSLEVALLLAEPGPVPPDPRAIGFALLDALRALAAETPLVVALDDVQWLDVSTAAVLQIALRRLRDERVGLLATLRKAPEAGATVELERCFPEEHLERVRVGPLNLGALHNLLAQRLSLELSKPELVRVLESSGGNPFFALELGREIGRTKQRPESGQALRVPESLRALLGGRLARLPEGTIDVLLHAAALARPTVELVTAVHADRDGVTRALADAVSEGVLELDDSRIRFAHPLIASLCYEEASIWKRRVVHRALAAAVADAEEQARHLALAAEGPDAGVAAALDTAAEHAAARSATAAAAELSELAASLTPADPALARKRRLAAAHFHRLSGNRERGIAILEALLTDVPDGVERADVLIALARSRRDDRGATASMCDEALIHAEGDDARVARVLAFRSWMRLTVLDIAGALADARAALEKAEGLDDPTLVAEAIARTAQVETYAGETTPGLLERGVEIEQRLGLELEYLDSPGVALARVLMRHAELDRAPTILERLEANAAARGDEGAHGQIEWMLSTLEWLSGRWRQALEHATAAHQLTSQTLDNHVRGLVGRTKALVEADMGLVEEARASAAEGLAFARGASMDIWTVSCLGVLGRLELELGNLEAAADYLRPLPGLLLDGGMNDPVAPIWADTIETLIACGELEQARAYLEPYERHAASLGSRYAIAGTARCTGLLAAADGDIAGAFAAFERALAELEGLPFPLERGRTLLGLGTVRRQARQRTASREALDQALAIFQELGAPLWSEKARSELRRISGRPPAPDQLTETERQVADLAAQGRSNKEIASALFMGVSTVEAHLSHVYRKLGIRSRTELARRLAMPVGDAPQS